MDLFSKSVVCKCTRCGQSQCRRLIARGKHRSFNKQPIQQFNKKSLLLIDYGLHEVAPPSLRVSPRGDGERLTSSVVEVEP